MFLSGPVFCQDLHFSQFFNSPLTTNPANTGSWRIMEKCGMKYETTEEHYGSPCVLYAISRETFFKNQID